MTDLTTRRPTRLLDDLPDLAGRGDLPPATPAAAPDAVPTVELSRLLALVRLTPSQAVELGAGVLAAARPPGPWPDGTGIDELVTVPGPVLVAADGRVLGGAVRDGGVAVLEAVVVAARVSATAADPAAERLLAELDLAVAELPAAGVAGAAQRLDAAAGDLDRPSVRAELGALVRAVGSVGGSGAGGAGHGGSGGGSSRTGERPRTDPAGSPTERTGSAGRRIGAWLLSILVLSGIVALEVVFLRDDIAADVDLLLDAGRSGADDAPADTGPEDPPLVAPAPAAAGSITEVDLRPLARCVPDAPCAVRLLVRVLPTAEPQVVTWSYEVLDRCTGAVVPAPGGTVTVPPQADRAVAVGVVPLPALPAVVLTAVTGTPARAASPPVVAGSCSSADGG